MRRLVYRLDAERRMTKADLSDRFFTLHEAVAEDLPAIAGIYAHHVLRGKGSFEEMPPSVDEIGRRRANVKARGLPWIVAKRESEIVGFSYASPYHARSAYRFTVQSSTYVHNDLHRRGIGRRLLLEAERVCAGRGYKQMMAAIGDSQNDSAIALYTALGFRTIGHALRVGVKFGRWVDVVYMQKALGEPSLLPPRQGPDGFVSMSDQTGP